MNAFCVFVACRCTLWSAAEASISRWCEALRSEGFAENPNCSLQLPAKAEENVCEFPCLSSSGITHAFKHFEKIGHLCRDNSSWRQARPSADISSGQQISAFNPWRVPPVPQLLASSGWAWGRQAGVRAKGWMGGAHVDGLQTWILWDGTAACNLLTRFVLAKNVIITALLKG